MPAVTELAKRLGDDHWRDRREAAETLGTYGNESELLEVMPHIGDCLDEMNWRVRAAAAGALGDVSTADLSGEPSKAACRAVPELLKRLADPDVKVRHEAKKPLYELHRTGALQSWGATIAEPAVQDLLRRLQDDDWRIREVAAKTLGDLGGMAMPAAAELVKLHGDEGVRVRNAAKAALEKLNLDPAMVGAPAAYALVHRLGVAEDWRAACGAAWALGHAGCSFVTGLATLGDLLSDGDGAVRFLAARALGDLGLVAIPVVPRLANLVDDIDERVRLTARAGLSRLAKALESRCPPAVPSTRRLLRKLEDEDSQEREAALKSLADLGLASASTMPDIMRHLSDNVPTVRNAAVNAVQRLGQAGTLGSLARAEEIEAPPPIIDELMDNLEDENWAVRLAAAEALCSLSVAAVNVWRKLQKTVAGEGDTDHRLKQAGKQVLGKLRKAGALIDRASSVLEAAVPEIYEHIDVDDPEVQKIAEATISELQAIGLIEADEESDSGLSTPSDRAPAEETSLPDARIASKLQNVAMREFLDDTTTSGHAADAQELPVAIASIV